MNGTAGSRDVCAGDHQGILDELREIKDDLSSLLKTAQGFFLYRIAISSDTPPQVRVILVSPSITEVAGITDCYNYQAWLDPIHPDDLPRILEASERSIRTGVPYDQVVRWYHSLRKEWIWVRTMSQPVFNEQGKLTHFNGLCIDITQMKRAELALQESESRIRYLIEVAPEAMFVQSGGRYRYLNPAMRKLIGASGADDLVNSEIFSRIAPEYHEAVHARIRKQLETGQSVPLMEMEFLRLDGGRIPVETTAVPIVYENAQAHLVFVHDISIRKKAEAEVRRRGEELRRINAELSLSEEQLRRLSEQLLLVAEEERRRIAVELHDGIGQYVCGLKFNMDTLVHQLEESGSVERDRLKAVSDLAAHTVDDIRRLVANLRPAILDSKSLDRAVEWLCDQYAGHDAIILEKDIELVDRALSETKRLAVFRVAQEALSNAIRHSQATVVKISLKWVHEGGVQLVVADNGRGFDLAVAMKSGVGLMSMQDRANASGGVLRIDPVPGKGTTVTAEWPP